MHVAHQTFQQRGYCRRPGYRRLERVLGDCAELYNAALEERRDAYRRKAVSVTLYDQMKQLTGVRADFEKWAGLDVTIGRGVLVRVDRAMKGFFRRVKAGEAPGYPRFKPRQRYRTLELSEVRRRMVRRSADGTRGIIRIKGLAGIQLRSSRPLPSSEQLRSLRLVLRGERLWVDLTYEVEKQPLPSSTRAVGIDLGVRKRVAFSDEAELEDLTRRRLDPSREIRLRQAVARSRKGSNRRRKRVALLRRECERQRISNRNWCHRVTTRIVRHYGRIAVEKLRIRPMMRSARGTVEKPGTKVGQKQRRNRSIGEQTWGMICQQLAYKAVWAGRQLVAVDPSNTSKTCSECGVLRRGPWRQYEVFECERCGLELDRDRNAALNILAKAFGRTGRGALRPEQARTLGGVLLGNTA